MADFYTDVPYSHSQDAERLARIQKESMGLDYGMGSGVDASYLYDQITPVKMTNPGGVLAPALMGTAAYFAGKNDLINRSVGALTPNQGSVTRKGPMRFAGRGAIPFKSSYGPLSRGDRHHGHRDERRMNERYDYDTTPYIQPEGYEEMSNRGYDSWSPADDTQELNTSAHEFQHQKTLGDALPYMTGALGRGELEPNIREDWDMLSPSIQDMLARELSTELAQYGLELTLESAKELIQERRKKNNNFTVGMLGDTQRHQTPVQQYEGTGVFGKINPLSLRPALKY